MVRLIAPNGATVDVDPEKAERLAGQGFRAHGDHPEPVAKKTRTRRTKADADPPAGDHPESAATDDE